MQLSYALRPEPTHDEATPASAYTRERRLLARYEQLLYSREPEALMQQVWGPLTQAQMYGSRVGNPGRIDRLDEDVPDLIRQLRPEEQEPIEALLQAGDLVGCIKKLLGNYRGGAKRETDTRKLLNDDGHAKAAGLGRLSREAYGKPKPLGEPLVLTPPVLLPRLSVQRRTKRRPAHCFHRAPNGQMSFWP